MLSGPILAMAETQSGAFGLLKWIGGGIGGGLTYAMAAVETNPETAVALTPSLDKSIYALVVAILAYVLKSYMPSEKKVTQQFEIQNSLLDRLERFATETKDEARDARKELVLHRVEMSNYMGRIDEKIDALKIGHDDMRGRLTRIERSQKDSGEIKR